ncbi:MAG TPA: hypothetical protein VET85_17060 [Stellaceae bacterium]|nr:hypothetical protein [Stellaceae bacterium]
MSLRLKFNLTLLIAFIAGLVIAGAVVHRIVVDQARAAVIQDARLMMQSATAIRNYTEQEIEPLLAAQAADRFLP